MPQYLFTYYDSGNLESNNLIFSLVQFCRVSNTLGFLQTMCIVFTLILSIALSSSIKSTLQCLLEGLQMFTIE